jgi:hypothetical protein
VKEINWSLDEKSEITPEWFKKNIDYFKFYGRDIETLLSKTKIAHSKRVYCKPNDEKKKLKVMVKIFGRKTPLELGYMQVEKE